MNQNRETSAVEAIELTSRSAVIEPGAVPVVLIHGALDRHNAFRRTARRVEGHRLVSFDRRGYGRSLALGAADHISRHVADVVAVADGLDADVVVLVGHSYGGLVALMAAAEFPERFPSVAAYEPPTPWKPWWPRPDDDPATNAPPEEVVEWFYRDVVGVDAWRRLGDRVRAELLAEGPALINDLLVGRDGPVLDIAAVTVPVMIGWGGRSTDRHRRAVEELLDELPDARGMQIDDAFHGAHRSHADAFARFIEATISRA